jgi:hypothetical protein
MSLSYPIRDRLVNAAECNLRAANARPVKRAVHNQKSVEPPTPSMWKSPARDPLIREAEG